MRLKYLNGSHVIGREKTIGPAALSGDVKINVDSLHVLHI